MIYERKFVKITNFMCDCSQRCASIADRHLLRRTANATDIRIASEKYFSRNPEIIREEQGILLAEEEEETLRILFKCLK